MRAALMFTAAAVLLYLAADRLLDLLERRAGRRFGHRSLLFFAILLVLALATFPMLRRVTGE